MQDAIAAFTDAELEQMFQAIKTEMERRKKVVEVQINERVLCTLRSFPNPPIAIPESGPWTILLFKNSHKAELEIDFNDDWDTFFNIEWPTGGIPTFFFSFAGIDQEAIATEQDPCLRLCPLEELPQEQAGYLKFAEWIIVNNWRRLFNERT